MTETPESNAEPTTATGQPRYDNPYDRPSRLGQVAAWVVIVAGVVFVVAVIFFSGFFLGRSSDGHHGWHRGYYGGRDCTYPMMGPGGMMGGRNDGTGRDGSRWTDGSSANAYDDDPNNAPPLVASRRWGLRRRD